MAEHIIVWDLETVPDLEAYAAVEGLEGKDEVEVRNSLGPKFPKHIFHKIACIGALVASRTEKSWKIDAIGAPHLGDRSEKDLIQGFVDRIAELKPRLITFNGSSFDLPVLRYRAMIHEVSAQGLSARSYFNRYSDDALDLCDVLASFDPRAKITLHALCRVLGLAGKPDDIDGSQVESYYRAGRIREVAEYCETDVMNTYRVWLRYALFRGELSRETYAESESNLVGWITERGESKSYLLPLAQPKSRQD